MPLLQTESDWLTLGKASQLLGVHPSTLRAWVDAGLIHAFLTPGGHRRFQLTELRAFLNRRRGDTETLTLDTAPNQTLQQVRQQLSKQPAAQQSWYQHMSDPERAKHRETGARLLGLLLQFVSRNKDTEHFVADGRTLVQEYGREFAQAGFSVSDLASAFLFFRRMIVNAAYYPEGGSAPIDAEGMRLLQRIHLFMDEMLIATLDAYEQGTRKTIAPLSPARPKNKIASRKRSRHTKN
jgi:excisionase family DNA binding protein